MASENFADAWATEEQYTNFRGKIHTYREWIDDAYNEQDRSESIAKWRRVFGEDFASGVSIEDGKSVGKFIVANMRRTLAEASQFTGDLVDAIKRFGARVLPAGFLLCAPSCASATGAGAVSGQTFAKIMVLHLKLVPGERIELPTNGLQNRRS